MDKEYIDKSDWKHRHQEASKNNDEETENDGGNGTVSSTHEDDVDSNGVVVVKVEDGVLESVTNSVVGMIPHEHPHPNNGTGEEE